MNQPPHITKLIEGRYQIDDFLAAGGMQEVYRARDIVLSREVALKTPFQSHSASSKKRFDRSANLSAKVNHPNAARTLDYLGTSTQYLIEELIQGENLGRLMASVERFDPDACAWILHHTARGLAAVHRHGVVHRDIKPGNIMIGGGWDCSSLKITDFGVAKMAAQEIEDAVSTGGGVTTSKTAIGALPYMAPEVINEPQKIELPSDVWALGALAFHLLTGSAPFGHGYAAVPRIQAAVLSGLPRALNDHPQFSHLAREIYGIISLCLHPEPARRPTAQALVALCDRLCYTSPARQIGVVTGYPGRRFGFIAPEGNGGSAFFHTDSVYGKIPREGQRVWYQSYPGNPQNRAHPVVPLENS